MASHRIAQLTRCSYPQDWPKRNFKLSFHARVFRWRPGAPAVSSIELHGGYQESGPVSYMRKALAHKFMEELGVPAVATRYARVRQNGAFYGLYLLVEEVDRVFLGRKGLNPDGRLFKAAHWKYSNLRAPDMGSECPFTAPDYDYWPRGEGKCPVIFAESGGPPGEAPGASHLRDVEALAAAVNKGDLSGFDINAVVTEMAAQTAMLHHDRCTKNRFYYEDKGRWTVIPYDMKGARGAMRAGWSRVLTLACVVAADAFATDNRGSGRNCAAEGNPCGNAETCVSQRLLLLTCMD